MKVPRTVFGEVAQRPSQARETVQVLGAFPVASMVVYSGQREAGPDIQKDRPDGSAQRVNNWFGTPREFHCFVVLPKHIVQVYFRYEIENHKERAGLVGADVGVFIEPVSGE